jgi:hypothetical protein
VSAGTLRFKADGTDRREERSTIYEEEEHVDIEVTFTRDGRMEFTVHKYYHRSDRQVRDASGRIIKRDVVERRVAKSGRHGSLMMRPTIKKFNGDWATVNTVRFDGDQVANKEYTAIQLMVTPVIKFDDYKGQSYGHDPQAGKWWRMLDAKWSFDP